MGIKALMLKMLIVLLNIVYMPLKLFPLKRKVVFISRQSDKPTIDIEMLDEYIKENCPGVRSKVIAKTMSSSVIGIFSYSVNLIMQMYHIATSKVVVVDGYCICVSVLKHKKATKIIQMWHALGAVKKFGYQTLDKSAGHSSEIAQIMRMHKNYDYVLCPSKITGEHFANAFNIEESKLTYLGLPRIDYLLKDDEDTVHKINNYYGFEDKKEIVLYVPTFRKEKTIDIMPLIQAFDFEHYMLVIKLHPLDAKTIDKEKIDTENGIIIDDRFTSYQWMKICDKIVTDYSALGIEAALVNKPLYFYLYDYEEYSSSVGLNIKLENEMGKYVQTDAKNLCNVMDESYDLSILNRFRGKYISIKTDNCTGKLVDFIVELMEEK